jgi:predicted TIM-barrel fold metal-dependent hydrolase
MNESTLPPDCLGPRALTGGCAWSVPPGSWDTHFHVLGPQHRFPYAANRKYTPPDASLEDCMRLHKALGISRGWVVHANTHGYDNGVDLDAVARSDGRYVAVVRLDASASPASCAELHARGARGVRFAFNPQHGGSLDKAVFDHVMRCVAPLGWFVELHFEAAAITTLQKWLESIPAQVVIDHFGRVDPAHGVEQEPFQILLGLLARGNFWIKLSGANRISRQAALYDDVAPFAKALVSTRADRLLWGTDWPHTGNFDASRVPSDSALLDALASFVPDVQEREAILVNNPLQLLKIAG